MGLLRELGAEPHQALEKIQQMRQLTFNEFVRLQFHAKAESIFALAGTAAATQGIPRAALVEVKVIGKRPASDEVEQELEEEDDGDDRDGNPHNGNMCAT